MSVISKQDPLKKEKPRNQPVGSSLQEGKTAIALRVFLFDDGRDDGREGLAGEGEKRLEGHIVVDPALEAVQIQTLLPQPFSEKLVLA